MKTQLVWTHLEVMSVSATLDLVGMEQTAQVGLAAGLFMVYFHELFYFVDIDECSSDALNTCDINASCMDIEGSFLCMCDIGYTGNGTFCDGEFQLRK